MFVFESSSGPNKAFLVPDSCRATVRNGFNIHVHVDVTDVTIENNLNETCFCSPPLYIIYLHCRKIHNLFVAALETGRKVSL
jgi:hypothetical protein